MLFEPTYQIPRDAKLLQLSALKSRLILVALPTFALLIAACSSSEPEAQPTIARGPTAVLPTATATAVPTPEPTIAPLPTATPVPSPTPGPTATPEPTSSPTPASQSAGLFEYSRAVRLLEVQEFDRAIAQFDLVIRKLPDFSRAFHGRGRAFFGDERYELALEDYDKAIELEPEFPGAYVDRGILREQQGNTESAVDDWNMAIEFADPIRHSGLISAVEKLLASVEL